MAVYAIAHGKGLRLWPLSPRPFQNDIQRAALAGYFIVRRRMAALFSALLLRGLCWPVSAVPFLLLVRGTNLLNVVAKRSFISAEGCRHSHSTRRPPPGKRAKPSPCLSVPPLGLSRALTRVAPPTPPGSPLGRCLVWTAVVSGRSRAEC